MIDLHAAVAVLRPTNLVLSPTSVEVTLEEGFAPYGRARIVCSMPSPEDRESIDLRATPLRLELRLQRHFGIPWSVADLTAASGGSVAAVTALLDGGAASTITNRLYRPLNGALVLPSQLRTFDLTVRSRTYDDASGELTIEAATDESILIDSVLLAEAPADPATADLATIVAWVLDRHDATLSPDSETATVAEASATLQQPGTTDWDYLDAMLEAASLRLWCDERRVWRIGQRQAVTPGSIVLSPSTMTQLRDTMTYDPDVWAASVLVEYRWVDELDLNRIERDYDGDGAPTRLIVMENTRYPGPGAAAGILARMQGRGRVVDIDADPNYLASPGMAATINPPETITLTGYVSKLTWKLPEPEMRVQTRGLVDTPDTAYLFGPPGFSYLDVDPDVSYHEFDWSMA